MDYPSLDRIAELQQLVADFAKVTRVPHLADNGQPENDAEHSFGLALTCWYLQPKIAPELDLGEILKYSLAHDIVELHAGDTFIFDQENWESKEERERAALVSLRKDWPDFPAMSDYAEGYMDKTSQEARFVKAVDKLLPVIMVELGEQSDFWRRHKITLEMEQANKVTIRVSEFVAPYYERLIEWLAERGHMHVES